MNCRLNYEVQIFGGLSAQLRAPFSCLFYPLLPGNGALVLTGSLLWFSLLKPEREIAVPLDKIRDVFVKKDPYARARSLLTF